MLALTAEVLLPTRTLGQRVKVTSAKGPGETFQYDEHLSTRQNCIDAIHRYCKKRNVKERWTYGHFGPGYVFVALRNDNLMRTDV